MDSGGTSWYWTALNGNMKTAKDDNSVDTKSGLEPFKNDEMIIENLAWFSIHWIHWQIIDVDKTGDVKLFFLTFQ